MKPFRPGGVWVTIQRATTVQDGYGADVETWVEVDRVPAVVRGLSGREYLSAQQIAAELSSEVEIRFRSDVEPRMRVVLGARVISIRAVVDPDGRRRRLVLMCEELNPGA